MLNVDYRILSKALAHGIKAVFEYIIDEDQTGFMQGHSITTNIRKSFEIIQYTQERTFLLSL